MRRNPSYEKRLFERKLRELGVLSPDAQRLMDQLGEQFTFEQLTAVADEESRGIRLLDGTVQRTAEYLLAVARANYEISFEPSERYSERVIFPVAPAEARGIEDARFVRFNDEAGRSTYYTTYTAFDGQIPLPQLLETEDFVRFKISTLNGPEVQNKGMALFPRVERKLRDAVAPRSREPPPGHLDPESGTGPTIAELHRPSRPGSCCRSATAARRSKQRRVGW